MKMLQVNAMTKDFGGLIAVNNVNLEAEKNKITGLIGPNGAGKTTLFNLISGFEEPTSGKVVFKDKNVTNSEPYKLVNNGLVRTFQIVRLFNKMTVLENVMAGCYIHTKTGIISAMLGLPSVKLEEKNTKKKSLDILEKLNIREMSDVLACNLSSGQQRLLEIARALATEPDLLMLDEPAAGLNSAETESLLWILKDLNKNGLSIFIIEHNMNFMMRLAEYIYVLDFGKLIAQGSPDILCKNEKVINAYLGKEYKNA